MSRIEKPGNGTGLREWARQSIEGFVASIPGVRGSDPLYAPDFAIQVGQARVQMCKFTFKSDPIFPPNPSFQCEARHPALIAVRA